MRIFRAPRNGKKFPCSPRRLAVSRAATSSCLRVCPTVSNTTSRRAPLTSKHYNIHVTDLSAVKQTQCHLIRTCGKWTGMPPETEERGGDLRAVIGTEVELQVVTGSSAAGRPDSAR